MQIQFIRHATFLLTINDFKILVDPMLSKAGAMEPIRNASNQLRIPLIDLPFADNELQEMLAQLDAILVTHTHRDHWDVAAQELLPKSLPLFCQPEDALTFRRAGFDNVQPIATELDWLGIKFYRVGGQHGTGEIGKKMGTVSGFVITPPSQETLYIAGDTIWCSEVKDALQNYKPDVIILNAGEATFLTGDRITMSAEDVWQVCKECPRAKVIAIHMEAVNHCQLTRIALKNYFSQIHVLSQIIIPQDGEKIVDIGDKGSKRIIES
jgi:L-ascorbate metabolism protein UlaG (beta-lactamase superfamily)